jgi:hypothetical protein
MKLLLPLSALLLLTTAACESSPWRHGTAKVDDAYLARVSDGDRDDIAELRASRAEMSDELAFAERRIEEERARKKVAEQEVDIAKQEVSRAEASLDVSMDNDNDAAETGREQLDAARAHVRWAEAQVAYLDLRIEQAKSERELAEKRVALAEAKLELRKAEAIDDSDDEALPDIDLVDYRDDVDEAQMDVELAEIELEACRKKADARQAMLDRRAEKTPKELRASWRTTAVEAGSKKK